MKTLSLIAIAWSLVVAGATLASAQDTAVLAPVSTAVDHASYLIIPATCHVNADSVAALHTVMCDGKVACTAKVLELVCGGGK